MEAKKLMDGSEPSKIFSNELELALWLKFYARANFEMGSVTKAFNLNKQSLEILRDNYSSLDPLILSTEIENSMMQANLSCKFNEIKNKIIEEISKTLLINNPHLTTKAYTALAYLYILSSQTRSSIATLEHAYKLYRVNKINDVYLYIRILDIFSHFPDKSNRALKTMSLQLSYDKEFKESTLFQNILKIKTLKSTFRFYKMWENLKVIDDVLKNLSDKNLNEKTKAYAFLKKWSYFELIGRDATSGYYLDEFKNILQKNYPHDSLESGKLNFAVFYELIGQNKKKQAKDFLNKIIAVMPCFQSSYGSSKNSNINTFSLTIKDMNVFISAFSEENVPDVQKKYEEFINLHKNYFDNEESEMLFDLNIILNTYGYSNVIKTVEFMDKK